MDDLALARALHVAAVLLWIGGVAFVATVLLPGLGREPSAAGERVAFFERVEGRFARQSRATTLLAGASGLYLVQRLGLWGRFLDPGSYWWMYAMVLTWLVFTVLLFVLEPLVLHRWLRERARRDPAGTLALITRLHHALLALGLVTLLGAVAGSHGFGF